MNDVLGDFCVRVINCSWVYQFLHESLGIPMDHVGSYITSCCAVIFQRRCFIYGLFDFVWSIRFIPCYTYFFFLFFFSIYISLFPSLPLNFFFSLLAHSYFAFFIHFLFYLFIFFFFISKIFLSTLFFIFSFP